MPKDPLFEIFQKEMTEAIMRDSATSDELISTVVEQYMERINGKGVIPKRLYQFIEEDVKEDVTCMVQKTTYGHFSLEDYKKANGHLINKLKVRGS